MRPVPQRPVSRQASPLIIGLLLLGAMWIAGGWACAAATPPTHTVQRGETLSSVARTHHLSIAELARLNGLKPTSWLTPGQRLKLPTPQIAAGTISEASTALPASVQKAINAASVRSGRWRYIVIHHSGTSEGSAQGMNQYHLRVRHMQHGLAYHFVIGNGRGMGDGEIFVGDRWKQQLDGGHLASETQNTYCLGICLVGNFDKELPTTRQLGSLKRLIEALDRRCNLTPSAVRTHKEINVVQTRCPGERFPTEAFLRGLRSSD